MAVNLYSLLLIIDLAKYIPVTACAYLVKRRLHTGEIGGIHRCRENVTSILRHSASGFGMNTKE